MAHMLGNHVTKFVKKLALIEEPNKAPKMRRLVARSQPGTHILQPINVTQVFVNKAPNSHGRGNLKYANMRAPMSPMKRARNSWRQFSLNS